MVRLPRSIDRQVAVHEAGHALLATLLHGHLERVTIVPDDECLGHTIVGMGYDTTDMLILLGGVAAERVQWGREIGGRGDDGNGDLDWFDGRCSPATIRSLLGVAESLLRLHRPALRTLVDALLVRKTLAGFEVREILAGKLTPKATPRNRRALLSTNGVSDVQ